MDLGNVELCIQTLHGEQQLFSSIFQQQFSLFGITGLYVALLACSVS